MFPLYNNGDLQFKIFAQITINKLNKGAYIKMQPIVKMPEANEFPIYQSLSKDMKRLFEFSLNQSNRFVFIENIKELSDYLKDAELTNDQKQSIKTLLTKFGFAFYNIKLSRYADRQKILFIYEKTKY